MDAKPGIRAHAAAHVAPAYVPITWTTDLKGTASLSQSDILSIVTYKKVAKLCPPSQMHAA